MTIFSIINFLGIWIPAAVAGAYVYLMKKMDSSFGVTLASVMPGLRVGVGVMALNVLVNLATYQNGKRRYGPFDALDYEHDPYIRPTNKQKAMYPPIPEEMRSKEPKGIVIGKRGKTYVCNDLSGGGAHHTIILGESGCGKTSTVVLDTLLCNQDSALFAIDVKGELHEKGAWMGREYVKIIDPEDKSSYGYDPFYCLGDNPSDQVLCSTMEAIAMSLIPLNPEETKTFWSDSARSLLMALLIYFYRQGAKNLIDIIEEIKKDSIRNHVTLIYEEADSESDERKLITTFQSMPDETLGGVYGQLSTAIDIFALNRDVQYMFRDNPRKVVPDDLNGGAQVFLSIKESMLGSYARIMHLIINQIITEMEKRLEGAAPALIVIDELPRILSVGKIMKLENALETLRSRNVTLLLIAQSLEALERAYKKAEVSSMLANCTYKVILSSTSLSTQKSICTWAGKYKEYKYTRSRSGGKVNVSTAMEDRDIVEGADLITLPKTGECIVISPHGYNRVKKVPYYKERKIMPLGKAVKENNDRYRSVHE